MKKSDFKKQIEEARKASVFFTKRILIKCKDKKYSDQGCYCCWYCESCGRTGCDNGLFSGNYEVEQCDLED